MYCTVHNKTFRPSRLAIFGSFTYQEHIEEFLLRHIKIYIYNLISSRSNWDHISYYVRWCVCVCLYIYVHIQSLLNCSTGIIIYVCSTKSSVNLVG